MSKASEPDLQVLSRDVRKVAAQALVVGVGQTPDGPVLVDSPLSPKTSSAVAGSFGLLGVTGAVDQVVRLPGLPELDAEMLVLAGLGPVSAGEPLSTEALRRTAGSAVRQLAGTETVALALPAASVADAAAVAEGALLGAYSFTEHRSSHASKMPAPVSSITVVTAAAGEPALKPALERARVLGRAVNSTRSLVNQPPSHLYPETFAAAAREAARGLPVKVTVWDEKKLEREGFGGILGVGKGSSRPPRLVKLEYSPARAKAKLALVGKGITFDSGGLSLKPAAGMQAMKSDMGGAAVVLNALLAIAELGLPVKVTSWLCLAENMPSGTAQRPSDVMTTYGGRTVEVLNTDAEGRLVMADGLAVASEESPDVLIDVATLTGAQMIALGNRVSAVMGEDGVRDAVKAAADRAGELFWPMPLPEELRASLDSATADIANIGERFGGMMTAAVFLREFVGEVDGVKIPWAHLDIAGPAFNEGKPYGYTPKEGTGVAVRTLVSYAEDVLARTA
ncbi:MULTISPECIES: leucyl aminopeptidase [Arthrobacter]|uniref:Probable cytosol aminopeptidase n=1 Tax=Arthrobacter caoxuetaonis TaxID=2886935 RepID=A0A9X1MFJ8_9MICC|nr:leucyl aminopeptidase [Arthrobacter caoxuetaonis]MCC3283750.1 leucyl aminopeptidase [Arthrobacter caoxuetaonis]MCC3299108.1 leucyl aminopeptidase [Arthrobacter caoxuetaonis]MCC9193187.1 leucyl aminopeptidase [Arthrobacter sp. zg-Y916]USQ58559.1 leucyl aminopeptidase [Arthrobacter caoxuetaonis]